MNLPSLSVRQFSSDQFCLDKTFYHNFYHLKGTQDKIKAPVVIDCGAHVGYFSFTALAAGAKKVYAIEPFIENYKMLLKNVGDNSLVIPYQLAIFNNAQRIVFSYPKPDKTHIDFSKVEPKTATSSSKYFVSQSITLDDFLSGYVEEKNVDILKISIGYMEPEILLQSQLLSEKVSNVCGETILDEDGVAKFKVQMEAKGFIKNHLSRDEEGNTLFIFSKTNLGDYFNI